MTHDELLATAKDVHYKVANGHTVETERIVKLLAGYVAVVELHKPVEGALKGFIQCKQCAFESGEGYDYDVYFQPYPCPTIQAITEQLK